MAGEGTAMRLVREQSEARNIAPVDSQGNPMTTITCAAAELIPTRQYANVTVGPIVVTRHIPDIGDDNLREEISKTQILCEEAVAEERKSLHALIRQSDSGRFTE